MIDCHVWSSMSRVKRDVLTLAAAFRTTLSGPIAYPRFSEAYYTLSSATCALARAAAYGCNAGLTFSLTSFSTICGQRPMNVVGSSSVSSSERIGSK